MFTVSMTPDMLNANVLLAVKVGEKSELKLYSMCTSSVNQIVEAMNGFDIATNETPADLSTANKFYDYITSHDFYEINDIKNALEIYYSSKGEIKGVLGVDTVLKSSVIRLSYTEVENNGITYFKLVNTSGQPFAFANIENHIDNVYEYNQSNSMYKFVHYLINLSENTLNHYIGYIFNVLNANNTYGYINQITFNHYNCCWNADNKFIDFFEPGTNPDFPLTNYFETPIYYNNYSAEKYIIKSLGGGGRITIKSHDYELTKLFVKNQTIIPETIILNPSCYKQLNNYTYKVFIPANTELSRSTADYLFINYKFRISNSNSKVKVSTGCYTIVYKIDDTNFKLNFADTDGRDVAGNNTLRKFTNFISPGTYFITDLFNTFYQTLQPVNLDMYCSYFCIRNVRTNTLHNVYSYNTSYNTPNVKKRYKYVTNEAKFIDKNNLYQFCIVDPTDNSIIDNPLYTQTELVQIIPDLLNNLE